MVDKKTVIPECFTVVQFSLFGEGLIGEFR